MSEAELSSTFRLDGRSVVVTGAAAGIGKRIAEVFADVGAKVVVADLRFEVADMLAKDLRAKGKCALALEMDVTRESSVAAGFERVRIEFGGIDVLVSNAGIQMVKPIKEWEFNAWRRMIAVHLDGAFLTAREAVRQMIASGSGGSIIFMGSVHSKTASACKGPYVAAKHGLLGLAKAIAKEEAVHNIRTNVICPGFVRTELVDRQIVERARSLGVDDDMVIRDMLAQTTVDGEFTTVDDVARAALVFATWPGNALTGQSLVVSHGWFMQQ